MTPATFLAQASDPLRPCGPPEEAGWLCELVDSAMGRPELARAADVLIARPVAVLLIFLCAWVLQRLARRGIRRLVGRVRQDQVSGYRRGSIKGLLDEEALNRRVQGRGALRRGLRRHPHRGHDPTARAVVGVARTAAPVEASFRRRPDRDSLPAAHPVAPTGQPGVAGPGRSTGLLRSSSDRDLAAGCSPTVMGML